MNIVDRGSGPPLVLIPGLQGRWEYQHATVDALAETFRVLRELRAAMSNRRARLSFSLDALRTGLGAPVSIGAMAERARLTTSDAAARDCAGITTPTLIITGEPHLDRVVRVESSAEYER